MSCHSIAGIDGDGQLSASSEVDLEEREEEVDVISEHLLITRGTDGSIRDRSPFLDR